MPGAESKTRLRALRQETLREYLSERGKVDYVFQNLEKIEKLSNKKIVDEDDSHRVNCLRIANEQRIKLMNKYLPDLKAVEVTGEGGGNLTIRVTEYANNDSE